MSNIIFHDSCAIRKDAPDGLVYLCTFCGLTSKDRVGTRVSKWLEHCFINAILVNEKSIEVDELGRPIKAVKAE